MKSKKCKMMAAAVAAIMIAGCCGAMFSGCVTNVDSSSDTADISSSTGDSSTNNSSTNNNGGINSDGTYSLEFTDQVSSWEKKTNAKAGVSYYTASAVYCSKPTHPGLQSLAVYAPTEYFNSDGSFNTTATVSGYTVNTAPIIYWNSHGSYIGMGPFAIGGLSTRSTQNYWVLNMIKRGFVICMVGERGKTTADADGNVIGRGPVAVSDLKAGVRFLKHNDDDIPGSSERIVSVGTSSGGAMSALLGASGNNDYYNTYLEEMGACMDETDDIFATMAYCPITDLPHADYAYEWMFNQDTTTFEMTDFQKALSDELKAEYASYINGLGLTDGSGNALTLAEDGSKSGSYYDWLISKYEESFETYAANYDTDYKGYTQNAGKGAIDAESLEWLDYDEETGKATISTPDGYSSAIDAFVLQGFRARGKNVLAFDSFNPIGGDNELFGEQGSKPNSAESARHYSKGDTDLIAKLQEAYPEAYAEYYESYYNDSYNSEIEEWAVYTNAYSFLTGAATSDVSPNFRINMGALDADTSITVSATLALLLEKAGINTEFNIMWDWGHNDCDTPTGLADWVDSLCK